MTKHSTNIVNSPSSLFPEGNRLTTLSCVLNLYQNCYFCAYLLSVTTVSLTMHFRLYLVHYLYKSG